MAVNARQKVTPKKKKSPSLLKRTPEQELRARQRKAKAEYLKKKGK